ncbi:MAG: GtrA family protein [Gammaproteobacteria bacterium]|nr:GtrA family protein [Gammaproteobacteria bacterium]
MHRLQDQSIARPDLLSVSKSLLMYGGAGAIGTAAHFAVLFATLQFMDPVPASTLGAIVGCVINYFLARRFVFASTASCGRSFPRFVTVAIIGIAFNAVVIGALVDVLPIALNQAVASGLVLLLGYFLNRTWTFDDHQV